MRSGELAHLSGVSSDTLRHYERQGLLPKPPRSAGGYRQYPATALDRVLLIRRALSIGFSLPELTTIVKMRDHGRPPCKEARALVATKLRDVKQQMRDLVAMRRQLERTLDDWDSRLARTAKGQPAHLLESLPDQSPHLKRTTRLQRNFKEKVRP